MENNNVKKYIKWGIIAIIFIGIYIGIAILIGNKDKVNSNNYLIVGDSLIWHEKSGKWYQETEFKENFGNRKFVGYNDMDEFTATTLQYNRRSFYFFDKDYNQVNNDKFRFAYSGNIKVTPVNYILSSYSNSDDSILDNKIKYQNSEEKSILKKRLVKYLADFDNDGKLEAIYITSNVSLVTKDYEDRSYMFYVKDGKVLDMKSDTSSSYGLIDILDIKSDNEYEIIIGRKIWDLALFDSCYQIYQIKDNKIILTQNCLYNK